MISYKQQEPLWDTPLVKILGGRERYGANVFAKLETVNPTGTHKDRGSAMIVLEMIEKGYETAVCASSGNAALSLSAFMYMNGLKAKIFLGDNVNQEKLDLIRVFKPEIEVVEGGYAAAVRKVLEAVEKHGYYNANAGYCQAKILGNAYIGREIAPFSPDVVVCPMNNGTHLVGVWEGLKGAEISPRMIASTAQFTKIASSIYGSYQLEEPKISTALKDSGGQFVSVSDKELVEETIFLSSQGILAEPASAASTAALKHIDLKEDDAVICIITGNGLKFPKQMRTLLHSK